MYSLSWRQNPFIKELFSAWTGSTIKKLSPPPVPMRSLSLMWSKCKGLTLFLPGIRSWPALTAAPRRFYLPMKTASLGCGTVETPRGQSQHTKAIQNGLVAFALRSIRISSFLVRSTGRWRCGTGDAGSPHKTCRPIRRRCCAWSGVGRGV